MSKLKVSPNNSVYEGRTSGGGIGFILSNLFHFNNGIYPIGLMPTLANSTCDIEAEVHYAPDGTSLEAGEVAIQNGNTLGGRDRCAVVLCEAVMSFSQIDDDRILEKVKRARAGLPGGIDPLSNTLEHRADVCLLKIVSPLYARDSLPDYFQAIDYQEAVRSIYENKLKNHISELL